ncbi:putative ABC transporter permease [Magnetofaba australis IT-1]|uniref:Putative ABC transporter permease n=2 Tax=Magnetofaba TaxID=1472292 RepID=A0A1Y2K5Y1_9PROT|nr:putative ABC transporter permease [Magnetofaba australis IT-1]
MFLSPLAWSLLAVLFFIISFMFLSMMQSYQDAVMLYAQMGQQLSVTEVVIRSLYANTAILLLLILPLVTMRLIADEKRRDTWPALAASPLSPTQIVLGKYLGLLLFLAAAITLIGLLPWTLSLYANPDVGVILSCMLGVFLVASAFGALGLAVSAATENPIVAAVVTFGLLLFLWIVGWMSSAVGDTAGEAIKFLALSDHYQNMLRGMVRLSDLVYFLLVVGFGLFVARHFLVSERIRG